MAAARLPRVFTRLVSSTSHQPASTLLTSPAQNTYTALTTKDLRALLQARDLKPWGKKPELISRLVASDAMSTSARPEPSKIVRAAAKDGQQGPRASNIPRSQSAAEKPPAPAAAQRAASTIAANFERPAEKSPAPAVQRPAARQSAAEKTPAPAVQRAASTIAATFERPAASQPAAEKIPAPAAQRPASTIAATFERPAEKAPAPVAQRAASTIAATFERAKAAVASTINGPTPAAAAAAPVQKRLEFTVSPLAVPKPWELAALENPVESFRVPYIQSTQTTAKHRGEVVPRVVVHHPAVNVLEGEGAVGKVGVVTEVGDDTVVGVPGQEGGEAEEKVGEAVQAGKEKVEEVKGVVDTAKEAVARWVGKEKMESKTGKIFAGDEGEAMTAEKERTLKIGAIGAGAWVALGEPVMRMLGII